jgi:hypothetical protein
MSLRNQKGGAVGVCNTLPGTIQVGPAIYKLTKCSSEQKLDGTPSTLREHTEGKTPYGMSLDEQSTHVATQPDTNPTILDSAHTVLPAALNILENLNASGVIKPALLTGLTSDSESPTSPGVPVDLTSNASYETQDTELTPSGTRTSSQSRSPSGAQPSTPSGAQPSTPSGAQPSTPSGAQPSTRSKTRSNLPEKKKATPIEIANKIVKNCRDEQLGKCRKALLSFFTEKKIAETVPDAAGLLKKLDDRIENLNKARGAQPSTRSRSRSNLPEKKKATPAAPKIKPHGSNKTKVEGIVTRAQRAQNAKNPPDTKQKRREKYQLIGSEEEEEFYMKKYLKYKQKYLELKQLINQ